ncbi:MAG: IS21 family transposase [Leptolyngbyaceae bacterium]|nr:IS21 family transposase [Leptolyngbyaceae bacterium]
MDKIREMLRLHELGRNQTEIARSCGVARSTVQDYLRRATAKELKYEQLKQLSDSEAKVLLGKGKQPHPPSEEPIDFETIHQELASKGVTLSLLWQEGIERGEWNCSYGGFCRRYNKWKGHQKLSMRQIYTAGEKLFVDYCGVSVPVVEPSTGTTTEAQIFVACLGASNYTFAEATPSQALPQWIGSHQRALAFYGGVPAAIIPDNLKSGVTAPCRYEPGINRTYQDFAEHYGVAIIPARVKKPRDKAKVEKAVQEVERQILAPLRHQQFTSFTELNEAIRGRLQQLNQRTMQGYGLSRRALFERTDQPALQPLPRYPFVFANWKKAKVNVDYHIEVERHYYSVPYWFARQEVSVKVSEQFIEVFYDHQRIAAHPRAQSPYRHTTVDDHMPPEHWAYKHQSKERFLAWAHQVGPHTTAQVEAIFDIKAHEEQAFRTIKGIQRLATHCGYDRLEAACQRANLFNMTGLRRLKAILNAHLDEVPPPLEAPATSVIVHDNVRGQSYYR